MQCMIHCYGEHLLWILFIVPWNITLFLALFLSRECSLGKGGRFSYGVKILDLRTFSTIWQYVQHLEIIVPYQLRRQQYWADPLRCRYSVVSTMFDVLWEIPSNINSHKVRSVSTELPAPTMKAKAMWVFFHCRYCGMPYRSLKYRPFSPYIWTQWSHPCTLQYVDSRALLMSKSRGKVIKMT